MTVESELEKVKAKITKESIREAFSNKEFTDKQVIEVREYLFELSQIIYYELFEN